MNLLRFVFEANPQAVDAIAEGEDRVGLRRVLEVLGELDHDLPFADPERTMPLLDMEPLGPLLRESYLSVLNRDLWNRILEGARPADFSREPDWVVFTPGQGPMGLTLPEDFSGSQRVSFFTSVDGSTRRISIEYGGGSAEPSGISVALPAACSLPNWARCEPGDGCAGTCTLERRFDPDGLICRCE